MRLRTKEIFRNLIGSWQLKRKIENYGTASGMAIFEPLKENHLHYREDLEVTPTKETHASYKAHREYSYIYDELENNISQHFIDGNLFCKFNFLPKSNIARGKHICSMDHYKAIYNFIEKNRFIITYQVTGPHKKYTIETEYRKFSSNDIILL